jgi:hypothetical protein
MACIALASARKVTIPPCITARTAFSMFCAWRIAKINLATSACPMKIQILLENVKGIPPGSGHSTL